MGAGFCVVVGAIIAWDFTWFLHSCTVEKLLKEILAEIKKGEGCADVRETDKEG